MMTVFEYVRGFFKWERKKSYTLLSLVATTTKQKACGVIRQTELKLHEEEFINFKIGKYYDRYQKDRISN